MEFNEKLQELRKARGMTQDELAQQLYVSRAAISKWESGRGYPNIDSLKAIAKCFSVSIDALLSSDEVLTIAQEDQKQKADRMNEMVFGMLDCSHAMLLFLPLFGQMDAGSIRSVSLLALNNAGAGIRVLYLAVTGSIVLCGILALSMYHRQETLWAHSKTKLSLAVSAAAVLLFILGRQPYAAGLVFILMMIKALMLIKWP